MSSSETGGSSGPRRSPSRSRVGPLVMMRWASCTAARVPASSCRASARARPSRSGLRRCRSPVGVHAHDEAHCRVGLVGQRRLDERARPVDEHVEGLEEELPLGAEVGVEDRRRDADGLDDVADPGAAVAAAGELQRRGLQDRVPGLLRAPGDEVGLRGLPLLDQRPDAFADLVERHAVVLEPADLPQRLDVQVAVHGAARRRLLRRREQAVAHVVVDGAPRRGRRALELGDGQRPDLVRRRLSLAGHPVHGFSAALLCQAGR